MKELNYNKIRTFIDYYERCFKNGVRSRDWWEQLALDQSAESMNNMFNECLNDCTYQEIYEICKIIIRGATIDE